MVTSSIVPQTNSPSQPSQTLADYKPTDRSYFGALVLFAAVIPLPFLAALITLVVYLAPTSISEGELFQWPGSRILVIILGLVITFVFWLLTAIPGKQFATAQGGRPSDYASLQTVSEVLNRQFKVVQNDQSSQNTVQYEVAIAEIEGNFENYNSGIKIKGLPWVMYSGYVSMWDRINKVDEAMVGVLPHDTLIESANYDILRLTDSEVPNHEYHVKSLNDAINTLRPGSKDLTGSSIATNGQDSQQTTQAAKSNIRRAKSALHKFTNERWDGLVRARNQLMGTAFLTAFFTYILVIIAILAPVPRIKIVEAMVFYFLGAIVGLIGRLFDERKADKVMDDYGLSTMRIIVTPLIAGLAALLGILFVTSSSINTLYEITLQNLVFAAVLGYAPNTLISLLQNRSEDIKSQLKGANPSDRTNRRNSG